jgi:protocatechuate 3,4-dioxygenase beta subunit
VALAQPSSCPPTRRDWEGPFYKPNAPVRSAIGQGLVIAGTVRSAKDCAPIPRAQIEWWQANPRGEYDDAHRARMEADGNGAYRFQTNFPGKYPGRPHHIHVKVRGPGHRPLMTQLYPVDGQSQLAFDFVLVPE